MDGTKLELSENTTNEPTSQPATYKIIPEADMEEEAIRTKSHKLDDGADEKMLPEQAKINEKQNGDAKLDIGEIKTAFVGLTKEELMKYANDPFWIRLRWFLFITFWILWALMLLGAIMIILAAPKCNPPPPRTWWEKGPLAEIDSTNPPPIDKLKELNINGVIMQWPDDTYNQFDETHKMLQTLQTFKENEINVILELEPSYSHLWFNKSESNDPDFSDFYIWQTGKHTSNNGQPQPPNNWVTIRNTSAWIYSEKKQEYFYAPLGFPHLNFRNTNVTNEFTQRLKKFLQVGFNGIRLKGAPNLLVDGRFNDESHVQNPGGCVLTDYCFYTHTQTEHLDDLAPLLKQWRDVVKNLTDNGPFMISDDLTPNIEAYKVNNSYVVDLPLQNNLFYKQDALSLIRILKTVFTTNNFTWPLWKTNSRSEWDIVTYLLPGTPLITINATNNKDLLKQRISPSIMRGPFKLYALNQDTILAFTRVTAGNPGILVAYNPTENRTIVDFPSAIKTIPEEVTVLLYSSNYNETDININLKHSANSVPISPKSSIVLSYVPKEEK